MQTYVTAAETHKTWKYMLQVMTGLLAGQLNAEKDNLIFIRWLSLHLGLPDENAKTSTLFSTMK